MNVLHNYICTCALVRICNVLVYDYSSKKLAHAQATYFILFMPCAMSRCCCCARCARPSEAATRSLRCATCACTTRSCSVRISSLEGRGRTGTGDATSTLPPLSLVLMASLSDLSEHSIICGTTRSSPCSRSAAICSGKTTQTQQTRWVRDYSLYTVCLFF